METIPAGPNDVKKERLAKWKQKKQERDRLLRNNNGTTSKTQQDMQLNNSDASNANKMAERRKKLELWRQKKMQQDSLKSKQDVIGSGLLKTSRKSKVLNVKGTEEQQQGLSRRINKVLRKKIGKVKSVFEESDDEVEAPKLKLFKPGTEENTDPSPVAEEEDTLDVYMRGLKADSSKNALSATDIFEQEPDEHLSFDANRTESMSESEYMRLAKMKAKKQLRMVQYSEEELEPFVKNLYQEPDEIRSMSEEEVADLRLALDNTTVKGVGCPRPIMKWSHLGLSSDIMYQLERELHFSVPTPIQAQAIPAIMSGKDVIGISKTGSGKTVSFLLPLLRQIKVQRPLSPDETGPIGLLLAPTRELAMQIHEEVVKFTAKTPGLRSICCTGGSELKKQISDIKRGMEIVVATPGRFIDLLSLNGGKLVNPRRIVFVVMDEADRLFDLGFEPQINQIMKCIRPDKQCVLFSATFPAKLKSFASKILTKPVYITINSKSLINGNIKQKVEIFGNEEDKFKSLLHWLAEVEDQHPQSENKTIVFVSSQQICDILYNRLEAFRSPIFAIHAGKPSNERAWNLQSFKETKNGILLCTEVLSRGLNVPEVSLVILYNAAKSFAQYVHTTGRTARGNNTGTALTMLMNTELAGAYILMKSMRDEELAEHHIATVSKLRQMSDEFNEGLKTGKYRIIKGFGGKGLDHLDKVNEEKYKEQNKELGIEATRIAEHKTPIPETVEDIHGITIPRLEYTVEKSTNPDTSSTYFAYVQINDLPQLVRWEATKYTTLSSIKHETGCSITNKGRFYPNGQGPQSTEDEPKLYLLVESTSDKDISLAIELLEAKVKEGVRKSNMQEIRSTKYTI
ncbi:HER023Wp [Eremothecium sinecaudum]|uniref:RNA helicase n=1 Tax=Eremothecium sinecaudum TaxID=45286 RepID=A0A109UZG4_9SACH|nr:HER023Wp [Eremothecium sinecaudum]AMD21302.1 HER023Wp [Eremothecium sinecaudum]